MIADSPLERKTREMSELSQRMSDDEVRAISDERLHALLDAIVALDGDKQMHFMILITDVKALRRECLMRGADLLAEPEVIRVAFPDAEWEALRDENRAIVDDAMRRWGPPARKPSLWERIRRAFPSSESIPPKDQTR